MGSHGIRNRSPHGHRKATRNPLSPLPQTPPASTLVSVALAFVATVAVWAVVVTLILAH